MDTEIYNMNNKKYILDLFEMQYVFEVTKCCNYFVWISVFKSFSLKHLYENVKAHFEITSKPEEIKLIVINNINNEKLVLPNDDTLIKEFIKQNADFFCPLYLFPAKIIYKIHLDYGYCHSFYSKDCKLHKITI